MSKFTPGKWEALFAEGNVYSDREILIARTASLNWRYSKKERGKAYAERRTNGLLMAAAPEMYRLLSSLLNRRVIIDDCAVDEIKQLLASIDGKEEITAHEGTD